MIHKIFHFMQLTDLLFTSGMPTPEQVSSLSEHGIQVVINLATPTSEGSIPNEKELVEAQDIKYHNIPVEWNKPTAEDLNNFFDLMKQNKDSKMLIHCQANYRVSCFIALYRILQLGWEKETAFEVMNKMWNPEDFPVWWEFIEKNLNTV